MDNICVPGCFVFVSRTEVDFWVDGMDETMCNGRYLIDVALVGLECGEVDVHGLTLNTALISDVSDIVGIRVFLIEYVHFFRVVIVAGKHYKTAGIFRYLFVAEFYECVFVAEYVTFAGYSVLAEDAIEEDVVDGECAAIVACTEYGDGTIFRQQGVQHVGIDGIGFLNLSGAGC